MNEFNHISSYGTIYFPFFLHFMGNYEAMMPQRKVLCLAQQWQQKKKKACILVATLLIHGSRLHTVEVKSQKKNRILKVILSGLLDGTPAP